MPDAATPPRKRRTPVSSLGWWLLRTVWPAVALFIGIALLLWNRAEPKVVWGLSGAAALLFLVFFAAIQRRLRSAGRSVANVVRSLLFSFVVSALLVLLVWWVFLR